MKFMKPSTLYLDETYTESSLMSVFRKQNRILYHIISYNTFKMEKKYCNFVLDTILGYKNKLIHGPNTYLELYIC